MGEGLATTPFEPERVGISCRKGFRRTSGREGHQLSAANGNLRRGLNSYSHTIAIDGTIVTTMEST